MSINRERLLIATMGKLSAPESVQAAVFRKAGQDVRFRPAEVSWRKLTPTYIEVLADDPTDQLARVVNRITNQPMDVRLKQPKDLGETMVIAHAVVAAEAGADVIVLIDDGRGAQGRRHAAHPRQRRNVATSTDAYAGSTHGLPPIEKTDLLTTPLWKQSR